MQRSKKIAAALIMLGLGFGTAMLFRRTDSTKSAAPAAEASVPQKEALVLRDSAGHTLQPTTGSQLGPVPLKPSKATKPPRELSKPIAPPETPTAPPELPLRFDRSLINSEGSAVESERSFASQHHNDSPLSTVPQGTPPLRIHRVVDGDTLGRLAARFLGDANRHNEIYVLNHAKLPDPNVLPIGVELKIPPRDGTVALRPVSPPDEDTRSELSSAAGYPLSTPLYGPATDTGLVPVTVGRPKNP